MIFDQHLREELLAEAITATRRVMTNEDAPPTALTSATSNVIALIKMLEQRNSADKEASEMTAAELNEAIAILRGKRDNPDEDESADADNPLD